MKGLIRHLYLSGKWQGLESKNKHHKDTCHDEIELSTQNIDIILDSTLSNQDGLCGH